MREREKEGKAVKWHEPTAPFAACLLEATSKNKWKEYWTLNKTDKTNALYKTKHHIRYITPILFEVFALIDNFGIFELSFQKEKRSHCL